MSRPTKRIRNLFIIPAFLAGVAFGVAVWAVATVGLADLTLELNLAVMVVFGILGLAGLYLGRGQPLLDNRQGLNTAKAVALVLCLPMSGVSAVKALLKIRW